MRLIFVLCVLLLSTITFASELVVMSRNSSYKLVYDDEKVEVQGYLVHLTMTKNKCNHNILSDFHSRMKGLFRERPLVTSPIKEGFEFHLDGKRYFESNHSSRGKQLIVMPQEIQRMKIEEKYRCNP